MLYIHIYIFLTIQESVAYHDTPAQCTLACISQEQKYSLP